MRHIARIATGSRANPTFQVSGMPSRIEHTGICVSVSHCACASVTPERNYPGKSHSNFAYLFLVNMVIKVKLDVDASRLPPLLTIIIITNRSSDGLRGNNNNNTPADIAEEYPLSSSTYVPTSTSTHLRRRITLITTPIRVTPIYGTRDERRGCANTGSNHSTQAKGVLKPYRL